MPVVPARSITPASTVAEVGSGRRQNKVSHLYGIAGDPHGWLSRASFSAWGLEHQPDLGDQIAGSVECRRHRQVRQVRGCGDEIGTCIGVESRHLAKQVINEALPTVARQHAEVAHVAVVRRR